MEDSQDSNSLFGSLRRPTLFRSSERQKDNVGRRPTLFSPFTDSMKRNGTLSRPERRTTIKNPNMFQKPPEKPSVWVLFSWAVTCCLPSFILKCCISKPQQQAWREKIALCFIAALFMAFTVFFLVYFEKALCPPDLELNIPLNVFGGVVIFGKMYHVSKMIPPYNTLFEGTDSDLANAGTDVSQAFKTADITTCQSSQSSKFQFSKTKHICEPDDCLNLEDLKRNYNLVEFTNYQTGSNKSLTVNSYPSFDWKDIRERNLVAYGNTGIGLLILTYIVLNFEPYLLQNPNPIPNDAADALIRKSRTMTDITLLLSSSKEVQGDARDCLVNKFYAGQLTHQTVGCILSQIIIWVVSFIILGITFSKFFMAIAFDWFVATRLCKEPRANTIRNKYATIASARPILHDNDVQAPAALRPSPYATDYDLYTVLLVTCYSEGYASIKGTIDSLAVTHYDDQKKLLFVIADGIVKGSGNEKSTPDILLDMMEFDTRFSKNPHPQSYIAVATGSKQHNMAKVYAGYYKIDGRRVPMILIVKCGTPEEMNHDAEGNIIGKPGNRGKRDSQLILMRFFSRVTQGDYMFPLEYDIFRKIHHITGVTPDFFEAVLMVDADTQVERPSLRYLINTLQNNHKIIGLCGETQITNKSQSWVTMIQVFEYFISHQLGKAFESLFGGVTCLPGCFCMWRIKSIDSEGNSTPILGNPDIVEQYSTNEVFTLHQKNLLLLGEDRFLTTSMLKQFPKRKTVYVSKAICYTVVPDDFRTLLSQRRRWVNSTIHNLMELVFVSNLCGTFCFSMQFLVLMDLISTAVLPAGLLATYYLLYNIAIDPPSASDITAYMMAVTMIVVIFLPAFLVLFTGRKLSNIFWMVIYLIALPIWQFVLPLYAFWNFDDFSWGETRKVAGEKESRDGHGGDDGTFDNSVVPLRRWEDYEANWRKNRLSAQIPGTKAYNAITSKRGEGSSHQQGSISHRVKTNPRIVAIQHDR
ncbi:hypothetical protein HDV02_000078 [Globomyces sp. JEL0801]|nr:hypothetical protein HDV02_000078 [Globomyces sp. JEL0801]